MKLLKGCANLAASYLESIVVLLQAEPGHACRRPRRRTCVCRGKRSYGEEEYGYRQQHENVHKIGSNHVYCGERRAVRETKMRYLTLDAS